MVRFKDIFSKYVGHTFPVETLPQSDVKIDRPAGALADLRKEATKHNFKLYIEWPENNGRVPALRDCMHVQVEKVTEDTYKIGEKIHYHSDYGAPKIL
jgi:hypothetical protein